MKMVSTVFAVVSLVLLEETDDHQDECIRANAARVHFIEIAIDEELFQQQKKRRKTRRVGLDVGLYQSDVVETVGHVEGNIHLQIQCEIIHC